jgi:hypothetical protein
MISYKYWKILNENRDINLGIRSPGNFGVMGEAPMLMSMGMKRMSPDGDMGGPPMGKKSPMGKPGIGDDMGDEEGPDEEEGGDEFDDDEDDFDDEDDGEDDEMGEDEEGEGDDEMGDEEEVPPMKPPIGKPGMKPPMGKPPMESYMREGDERLKNTRPKAPNSKLDKQTKKSQRDDSTDTLSKDNNESPKHKLNDPGFCKKCSKMKKCAKCSSMKEEAGMKCSKCSGMMHKMSGGMKCKKCGMMKKMMEHDMKCKKCSGMMEKGKCKKCNMMGKAGLGKVKGQTKFVAEHSEFYAKLQEMTGGTKFEQDELGFWVPVREDYLIAPEDDNSAGTKPGHVGHAPSQYMGMSGGLSSPNDSSYQEWLGKRRK